MLNPALIARRRRAVTSLVPIVVGDYQANSVTPDVAVDFVNGFYYHDGAERSALTDFATGDNTGFTIALADLPAWTNDLCISIVGTWTYADDGSTTTATPVYFYQNSSNNITAHMATLTTRTGEITLQMKVAGTTANTASGQTEYAPGTDQPFGLAFRLSNSSLNMASKGVSFTEAAVSTALLQEVADLNFAYSGGLQSAVFNIHGVCIWTSPIGDTGIEEASAIDFFQ